MSEILDVKKDEIPKLEEIKYSDYKDLSAPLQIDLLNAFKKLLSKTPCKPETLANKIIIAEYEKWILDQMEKILNPVVSGAPFTESEIAALKMFAAKVMTTAQKEAQPVQKPQPQVQSQQPKKVYSESKNIDSEKWTKAQRDMLRELEQMEREGPNF